jgi:hypothetical protein
MFEWEEVVDPVEIARLNARLRRVLTAKNER